MRGFTESLNQEMIVAKHPVKVTCVHRVVKTAIARNATMSGDVDERKLTDAFEKYFLRMDAAKAADIIIRGVEEPCARPRRQRREGAGPVGPARRIGLPTHRRAGDRVCHGALEQSSPPKQSPPARLHEAVAPQPLVDQCDAVLPGLPPTGHVRQIGGVVRRRPC